MLSLSPSLSSPFSALRPPLHQTLEFSVHSHMNPKYQTGPGLPSLFGVPSTIRWSFSDQSRHFPLSGPSQISWGALSRISGPLIPGRLPIWTRPWADWCSPPRRTGTPKLRNSSMTAPLRLSPLLPLLLHLLLLVIYPRLSSIRSISSFGKLYKTPVRGSPVSFFFFCRVALYVRIFGCFYSVRELSIPFGVHWMLRLSFGVQLSVIDSHASLSSPLK